MWPAGKQYSKSYLSVSHFKRPERKAHYSPASCKFLPIHRAVKAQCFFANCDNFIFYLFQMSKMLHHYSTCCSNGRIRQTIMSANKLILQQKSVLRNSASVCFPVRNLSPKRWPSRPSAGVHKTRAPSRTGNYFFLGCAHICTYLSIQIAKFI